MGSRKHHPLPRFYRGNARTGAILGKRYDLRSHAAEGVYSKHLPERAGETLGSFKSIIHGNPGDRSCTICRIRMQ